MTKPLCVVFDVNVLFSWAGWRGAPYRCVEAARDANRVQSVSCMPILDKLAEKLRLKLGFSEAQVLDALADILSFTRLMELPDAIAAISASQRMILCWRVQRQGKQIISSLATSVIFYR